MWRTWVKSIDSFWNFQELDDIIMTWTGGRHYYYLVYLLSYA